MSRPSVFDRLGPRVEDDEATLRNPHPGKRTYKEELLKGLEHLTCLDDEIAARREALRRAQNDSAAGPRSPGSLPAMRRPDTKMLQRTISEIARARMVDSTNTRPTPSVQPPATSEDAAKLAEQLRLPEEERKAAQELAEALMMQQQALMAEKQKFQRENDALQTERQHLLERLCYLEEFGGGDDYFDSPLVLPPEGSGSGLCPIHDKVRQLYFDDGHYDDEHQDTLDSIALDKLELGDD